MLQLKPFDRWPDVVCLPPGAVDIQDLADWAAAERLATADEVMDMLTGKAAPALETAPPAPVVVPAGVVPASNGPAKPVDRGWVMKKAALIKKHTHQWNTIEADFHGASENGLSKAARTDVKGQWFEADALNWARQRGKLTEENQQGPATLATAWKTTKHSSDD